MGQKSNLITLYTNNIFLNLSNSNNKILLWGLYFIKMFKRLLLKKKVLVINEIMNVSCNTLFLNCNLFYETSKIKNYKKKKKVLNPLKNKFFSKILLKIGEKFTNKFKINCIQTNFEILNKLDSKFLKFLYKHLRIYLKVIFSRQINLFIDFLKLTVLYYYAKVDLSTFCYVLTEVFRNLEKKKHAKFFSFIKKVFYLLVFESKKLQRSINNRFVGVKFIISGRFKGKPKTSTTYIQIGNISIQSISKSIDFSKLHTFTSKFGVFGFKIWVQNSI